MNNIQVSTQNARPANTRWRLPAVITQLLMDFDVEWSVNFWFVCKKWRNHGSVRRSVRIPVYTVNLGYESKRIYELFVADYFGIYFNSAIATNVRYECGDNNEYVKKMDVQLDLNMIDSNTNLYTTLGPDQILKDIIVATATMTADGQYEDDSRYTSIYNILSVINTNYILTTAWTMFAPCDKNRHKVMHLMYNELPWGVIDNKFTKNIKKYGPTQLHCEQGYAHGRIFEHPDINKLARGLKIEYYVVPMGIVSNMQVADLQVKCWRDPINHIVYTDTDRLYNVQLSQLKFSEQIEIYLSNSEILKRVEEYQTDYEIFEPADDYQPSYENEYIDENWDDY